MISKVILILRVYTIRGNQTGYSGNVINFPKDVAIFARKLPRVPAHANVIVVKRGTAPYVVNCLAQRVWLEYLKNMSSSKLKLKSMK